MEASDSIPKRTVTSTASVLGVTLQAIHKQTRLNSITLPKIGNKSYITHDVGKGLFSLFFKKQKISFQIVKGGTGKTTALHNIACAASLYGAKILAVDLDPQGNLTDVFNIDANDFPVLIDIFEGSCSTKEAIVSVHPGIDLIPSRIENVVLDNKLALSKAPLHTFFSTILSEVEDDYDFIFIDCPPTMGHTVSAAALYVDTLLVPLNPDSFSAKGLKILKQEISNLNKMYKKIISYKVFLNKYSSNTILSDKAIQTTIASETSTNNALNTAIRLSQEIPNLTDQNLNLFSNIKQSNVRDDFDILTRELLDIDVISDKIKADNSSQAELEKNNAIS